MFSLGCFLLTLAISTLLGIYRAYIISRLWAWFVVPIWHFDTLSTGYIFALLCLVPLIQGYKHEETKEKEMVDVLFNAINASVHAAIFYSIMWFEAWIVQRVVF